MDHESWSDSVGGYILTLAVVFFIPPVAILLLRAAEHHYPGRASSIALAPVRHVLLRLGLYRALSTVKRCGRPVSGTQPFNLQVERWLYARTRYGLALDCTAAALALVSCALVLFSATFPFTEPDPPWALALEVSITLYFLCDYLLRLYLSQNRLAFYLSPLGILDFITIVPALVALSVVAGSSAFIVSQALRGLRIFRVVRLLRIVALSTSSSLTRQFIILGITVLALVFAFAAIFQIVDSTPENATSLLNSVLYMTITVIGRPPVTTHTDGAKILEIFAIFVGSFVLPAFIAELARLYFESQGREVYAPDARVPHVIVAGDLNVERISAFLQQFFHRARDPATLSPLVVLAEHRYEGAVRALLEQSRYVSSVRYIRGCARRPADLARAACGHASAIIVLTRRDADAGTADGEVVAMVLATKSISRRVRVLAQLRRPRARDHLLCLPGWRESDRAVVVPSLSMTLLGVGCLVPGLPTLLVNLVHAGSKDGARSSNPRRRKALILLSSRGLRLAPQAAGMLVAGTMPAWVAPLSAALGALETAGTALLGGAAGAPRIEPDYDASVEALVRPMSIEEEYTSGFAQEIFTFAVTPGLAGRSFAAAARIAYLRYGVLLIGARVPAGAAAAAAAAVAVAAAAAVARSAAPGVTPAHGLPPAPNPSAGNFEVLLFPGDLTLTTSMFAHAIAFDALDLAALLQGTGGGAAARAVAAHLGARETGAGMPRVASQAALGRCVTNMPEGSAAAAAWGVDHAAEDGVALPDAWGASHHAVEVRRQHNAAAELDVRVPWCFSEGEEDAVEALVGAASAAGMDAGKLFASSAAREGGGGKRSSWLTVHQCSCATNAQWAANAAAAAAAAAAASPPPAMPSQHAVGAAATAESRGATLRRRARAESTLDGDDGLGGDGEGGGPAPPLRLGQRLRTRDSDFEGRMGRGVGSSGSGGGILEEAVEEDDDDEEGGGDEEEEEEEEGEGDEDDEEGLGADDGFSLSLKSGDDGGRKAREGGALDLSSHRRRSSAVGGGSRELPPRHAMQARGGGSGGDRPRYARSRLASGDVESVYTVGDDGFGGGASDGGRVGGRSERGKGPLSSSTSTTLQQFVAGGIASKRGGVVGELFPFLYQQHGSNGNLAAAAVASSSGTSPRPPPLSSYFLQLPSVHGAAPLVASTLTPFSGHVLVCGISDGIGLLLRALQTTPPSPPSPSLLGPASELTSAVAAFARASGGGGSGGTSGGGLPRHVPIVILCPVSERPSDLAVNAMHPGSSRLLSRVTWVTGSPSDLGDLLRAGVETARAVLVLSSSKRPTNNADDNLSDDTDAIVIASAAYKLNPRVHVLTELTHGNHASYLRPCGTSITDAEDGAISFTRQAAMHRARTDARAARKATEEAALARKLLPVGGKASVVSPAPRAQKHPPPPSAARGSAAAAARAQSVGRGGEGGGAVATIPPVAVVAAAGAVPPLANSEAFPIARAASGGAKAAPLVVAATAPALPASPVERSVAEAVLPSSHLPTAPALSITVSQPPPVAVSPGSGAAAVADAAVGIVDASFAEDEDEALESLPGVGVVTSRLARERIRAALASGDSVGRTLVARPSANTRGPPLSSVFATPASTAVMLQQQQQQKQQEEDELVAGGGDELPPPRALAPAIVAPTALVIVTAPSSPTLPTLSSVRDVSSFDLAGAAVPDALTAAPAPATLVSVAALPQLPIPLPSPAAVAAAAAAGAAAPAVASALAGLVARRSDGGGPAVATMASVVTPLKRYMLAVAPPPPHPAEVEANAAAAAAAAAASASTSPPAADYFAAPAFAAGRAFSSTTLDALLCEAHFAPHALFVVKQLVRASRKQRLVLLPIADAIALALLASPRSMDTSTTAAAAAARSSAASGFRPPPTDEWDIAGASHYATRERLGGGDGHTAVELTTAPVPTVKVCDATAALFAGPGSPPIDLPEVRTYGQLLQALLRGWSLLPLGLYRRMQPGVPASPPIVPDPAAQFVASFAASTPPQVEFLGGNVVSYVFTNPPPDTVLSHLDLVFVLRSSSCGDGDGDD